MKTIINFLTFYQKENNNKHTHVICGPTKRKQGQNGHWHIR